MSKSQMNSPLRAAKCEARPTHLNLGLEIIYRDPAELIPKPGNAKKHSSKQIRQIADSMRQFGCINPFILDSDGNLLAGHGRHAAAKKLGLLSVPTICLDHLSEAEKRAFSLADNRLGELGGGWDNKLLAEEFSFILNSEIDFDAEVTGFALGTIELILDQGDPTIPEDEPPALQKRAVSRLGDVWLLGRHRLLCGDALDPISYSVLMARKRARLIFADVPYNLKIGGNVSGLGKVKHREFLAASGELSETEFTEFLTTAMTLMAKASLDGAIHYICMDWRHLFELLSAGRAAYDELLNLCVWAKPSAGMGSFYRSQHELVAVFKRGTRPQINNVELGKHGRHRSNLWNYGESSLSATRREELAMHPTVKPLQLVADAILDASRRDDLILDVFAGSGTTILAAEQTGRRARAMELDPLYCDVIIRRFQAATGITAVHADGQTFTAKESSAASAASAAGEGRS